MMFMQTTFVNCLSKLRSHFAQSSGIAPLLKRRLYTSALVPVPGFGTVSYALKFNLLGHTICKLLRESVVK